MAEAIRMPLLSDTMKEGVIAAWHKKVGDPVKSDDVLADVETDKATMEVMPYVDGTLLYVGVEQGKAAKVNDIIAIVGKKGEDFSALLKESGGDDSTRTSAPLEEASTAPAAATNPAPEEVPALNKTASPDDPEAAAKAAGATIVRMPLLSDTMKEGKIVVWHKAVGDQVKGDDVLAEVETDKATMEVMGYADGVLLHQGVKEGEAAPVNGIIAIVGKKGTDVTPFLSSQPAASAAAPGNRQAAVSVTGQAASAAPAPAQDAAPEGGSRIKASPLAKRLAREKGIDLKQVRGSGDGGRIIKRDVDEFKPSAALPQTAAAPGAPTASPQQATVPAGTEASTDAPVSQMRRVIAERLSESKFSAPHFYLRITVTMDGAMAARTMINEVSPVKVSFNDLIIKACAAALRRHPEVNASWMGDTIRTHQHVHIGMAVAIEDGLIVPVVKFADTKSLSQIAEETGVLGEKAKTKKLQPQEFTGNTFTVSNLGMMDIDEFTAIINPPDACILAVGKIAPTPVVEGGQVVVRNQMKLTLSCDHRVVDGAVGARFLQTLKKFLENPVTMLA